MKIGNPLHKWKIFSPFKMILQCLHGHLSIPILDWKCCRKRALQFGSNELISFTITKTNRSTQEGEETSNNISYHIRIDHPHYDMKPINKSPTYLTFVMSLSTDLNCSVPIFS